jgi:hypothetical protein
MLRAENVPARNNKEMVKDNNKEAVRRKEKIKERNRP